MTRVVLGLGAEGAVFAAAGYGLLLATGLARGRRSDWRLAGLAYLTGWALVGCSLSALLMLGIPSGVPTTVVLGAAFCVGGAALARRRSAAEPEPPEPSQRHPLALGAVIASGAILVLDLGAMLIVAVQNVWSTDLDLMTAWLPRAQLIHDTHSLSPAAWETFVTPWYPPLAPAMFATTFDFVGGFHPSVLPLQQVVLGIAFVTAALAVLGRFAPAWLALPPLALIVSTPWFWWRLESVLPDQTVAYLIAIGALACVGWLVERHVGWLAVATVVLTAASLTKIEGWLFAGLLVALVVGASLLMHRREALNGLWLLVAPAALVPWHLWLRGHSVATSTPDYNAPKAISIGFLADHLHRLDYAVHYLLRGPFGWFSTERLTATTIIVAIAVWAITVWRVPAVGLVVGAWLVLCFAALSAIYWTSRVDLYFYVVTSAPRVGTTIIVAAGVLTPLLLGLALQRASGRR